MYEEISVKQTQGLRTFFDLMLAWSQHWAYHLIFLHFFIRNSNWYLWCSFHFTLLNIVFVGFNSVKVQEGGGFEYQTDFLENNKSMNKPRKNKFIFNWTDSISARLTDKQGFECRDEEKWTHNSYTGSLKWATSSLT